MPDVASDPTIAAAKIAAQATIEAAQIAAHSSLIGAAVTAATIVGAVAGAAITAFFSYKSVREPLIRADRDARERAAAVAARLNAAVLETIQQVEQITSDYGSDFTKPVLLVDLPYPQDLQSIDKADLLGLGAQANRFIALIAPCLLEYEAAANACQASFGPTFTRQRPVLLPSAPPGFDAVQTAVKRYSTCLYRLQGALAGLDRTSEPSGKAFAPP